MTKRAGFSEVARKRAPRASQPRADVAADAIDGMLAEKFPYPDTCGNCNYYLQRRDVGAPDHTYGPSRGHRPHCTCEGCF